MFPWVNVPAPFVPLYTFPWPHEAIVVVPPASTVAPPTTPTAVGTLVNLALLITSEPPSLPLLGWEVRTKMGVFDTTASMIASAPTVYDIWVCYGFKGLLEKKVTAYLRGVRQTSRRQVKAHLWKYVQLGVRILWARTNLTVVNCDTLESPT